MEELQENANGIKTILSEAYDRPTKFTVSSETIALGRQWYGTVVL